MKRGARIPAAILPDQSEPTGVDPELRLAAEAQDFVKVRRRRHLGRNIEPVGSVQAAVFEPVAHEADGVVRKKNVDIGRQNEAAAGAPNADILGDHLEKRQLIGVRQLRMNFRRYRDNADLARTAVFGPNELLCQRFSVRGRIPFHEHELGAQIMPLALGDEPIHEMLHAQGQTAAVIVVARRGDNAEMDIACD